MKLESLHLQNWQPFRGRGVDATKIEIKSDSGQKNMIIYGENTHGKTAIWQAIQFGFFGKVNKRKTGWQEGKYKPWIWDNTAGEPLLNQTANEEGDFTFGVIIKFNHEGEDYTLERTGAPRQGISKPRNDGQMEKPDLYIRNDSKGMIVKEPQNFINDILPYDLAQFFMFDGERLDQYRLLFEDTNDVKLKGYIEAILRFPVLTDGVQDFGDIKKKEDKILRKFALRGVDDDELRKTVKELEDHVEENEIIVKEITEKKNKTESKLNIVTEWLKLNNKGAEALAQQKIFSDQIVKLEKEVEQAKERVSNQLPGSWRAIISSRIETRLDELDGEIKRQTLETKKIGEIETQLKSLEGRLKGDACGYCGHIHKKPDLQEKEEIHKKIIKLNKESTKLEKSRIDPDPHYLQTRQRALFDIKSTNKLDVLINLEADIVSKNQDIRDARSNLKKAMKILTSEAIREVQQYLAKQKELQDAIAVHEKDEERYEKYINECENEIKKLTARIQPKSQTIAHSKSEKKIKILSNLIEVWEDVTTQHRETMRARVEKNASDLFMSLTNKKKTYKGLKIHTNFQVEILHKKKSRGPEAGSGGQSALMAYSILDALTKSSGIEFPMVVDTPARSIDENNLGRLFDYLLLESEKQVIILPESKELKPKDGDDKYGGRCATTYEIELIGKDEDLSKLNLRINNTGKTNKEMGYDD